MSTVRHYAPNKDHLYQEIMHHLNMVTEEVGYLRHALSMQEGVTERAQTRERIGYWTLQQRMMVSALSSLVSDTEMRDAMDSDGGGEEWEQGGYDWEGQEGEEGEAV